MSGKLPFTLLLCSSGLWAQSPWQDLGPAAVPGTTTGLTARRIQLDRPRLEALLAGAPAPGSAAPAAALEILGPDGAVHKLLARESPILSPELQARMPEVRTYAVACQSITSMKAIPFFGHRKTECLNRMTRGASIV